MEKQVTKISNKKREMQFEGGQELGTYRCGKANQCHH